jgi:hypothetical protein
LVIKKRGILFLFRGIQWRAFYGQHYVQDPEHFTLDGAHDYFYHQNNILLRPYGFPYMKNERQLSRVFTIATHHGMLPWRHFSPTFDMCIAELYHLTVANQFGLDQDVPFAPLVSMYTIQDIRVAYAYWEHLLRPGRTYVKDPPPTPPRKAFSKITIVMGRVVDNLF